MEFEMSLTKSFYDAELMNNEEEEINAMFYYELERRRQLWIDSLPEWTEQSEIDDYLNLPENHWFSTSFERWMESYREHKALMLQLRTQIAQVNRKAQSDMNVSDPFDWMNVEENRMDLIIRHSDL
jgi:hypothetical protein